MNEFFITKICACVSDSGKDEYRNKNKNHQGMYKFRLLDDDGEIYLYGWSKTNDGDDAFLPLDCYGAAYGCTIIEYKTDSGEWEEL